MEEVVFCQHLIIIKKHGIDTPLTGGIVIDHRICVAIAIKVHLPEPNVITNTLRRSDDDPVTLSAMTGKVGDDIFLALRFPYN